MYKNSLNQIVFIVLILATTAGYAQNAPVVSNVTFAQRTDGSLKVDVYYDVYDADGDTLYVTLQASSDNGATWGLTCGNVTGAVGSNILSGTNKQIVWNFGQEKPNYYSEQIRVKVIATDIKCIGLQVEYDGKTYNTVQIGSQCWLKENLDIGVMITSITEADSQRNNGVIEKYCYDNNPANCNVYGGLYQWNEAMQFVTTQGTRGICPAGWHIPTENEFQTLSSAVGGNSNALKAMGQGSGGGAGTNTSGFSALLAGCRGTNGGFYYLSYVAYFWSSTEYSSAYARVLYLDYGNANVVFGSNSKEYGFSVRCVKD